MSNSWSFSVGDVRLIRTRNAVDRRRWAAEGGGQGVGNYRTPFGAWWALRRWQRTLAAAARMREERT